MRFYFVRHGLTINNQNHTFNGGGVDPILTTAGKEEAGNLGNYLQNVKFDCCYSSPLERARETAALILEKNELKTPKIEIFPDLLEMRLGDWDGHSILNLKESIELANYFNSPAKFNGHSIHAENYADVQKRNLRSLHQIYRLASSAHNILITSHGIFLTVLLKSLLGIPLNDVRENGLLPTSSVTIFDTFDGRDFSLVKWAIKPK